MVAKLAYHNNGHSVAAMQNLLYETMGLLWELPWLETEPAAEVESPWSMIFDVVILNKND